MPAVNLSPLFNAQQLFNTAGVPLSGGLINTYLAGTVTPALTYIDSSGATPNANPIVLDAAGLLPAEVWLVNATAYKFVVTNSLGANARTYDNITASLAATSSGSSFTATSNTGSFTAQLTAIGGLNGYQINNQAGTRSADFMFWGASSSPLYGMTAGWAGINAASGVGFTIGTNDLVRMTVDPTTGFTGFGMAPVAAKGQVQLLGSSSGGIALGNTNNTDGNALDWYEEGTFTPTVTFGGASVGMTYSINRMGRFTRIGNRVFFGLRVPVTAKGSSTGIARVAGLPYTADGAPGALPQGCVITSSGATVGLAGVATADVLDAQTTILLSQVSTAGVYSTLTDANYAAAFDIQLSGQYKV